MNNRTNGDRLTFTALRNANIARLPEFKNKQGGLSHPSPHEDGSNWCLAQWCNAVTGELGEAANLIKKIERGDFSLEEARDELAKEFADVVTYLDILAYRAGVNLGRATMDKWNEVSRRVGSKIRLCANSHYIKRDDEEEPRSFWDRMKEQSITQPEIDTATDWNKRADFGSR